MFQLISDTFSLLVTHVILSWPIWDGMGHLAIPTYKAAEGGGGEQLECSGSTTGLSEELSAALQHYV